MIPRWRARNACAERAEVALNSMTLVTLRPMPMVAGLDFPGAIRLRAASALSRALGVWALPFFSAWLGLPHTGP